jgi:hypothetical protein
MTTFVIYYCFTGATGVTVEVEADDAAAALAKVYDDLEHEHGPDVVGEFAWIRILRKEFLDGDGGHHGKRPEDGYLRGKARALAGPGMRKPIRGRKKKRVKEKPCTWETLPESIRAAFVTALNERNSK